MPTRTTSGGKQPRVPGEFGVGGESVMKDILVQVIEKLLCVFFLFLLFRSRLGPL